MRHDISTTAARIGNGAWAGNNARAIRARYANAADTFFSPEFFRNFALGILPETTCGIINKDSSDQLTTENCAAWSIINDNAYVNRCAAPGRNPGRGRHRKPNRGI
jgi:hypothetical protein